MLGELSTHVHGANDSGDSPLHLAARKGYEGLIDLLLKAGTKLILLKVKSSMQEIFYFLHFFYLAE